MKNPKVYDDGCSGKFIGFIGFIFVVMVIAIYIANCIYYSDSPAVEKQVKYHSKSILVKTLAAVPSGAFIHRFIDYDLERICYLNGAGGGIWCEPLPAVLANKDPELIEDIISDVGSLYASKNVPKWEHDDMKYYPKDYKPQINSHRYYNKQLGRNKTKY